jgi:hypothetical protein
LKRGVFRATQSSLASVGEVACGAIRGDFMA